MKYENVYEVSAYYGGEYEPQFKRVHNLSDAIQLTFGAEHWTIDIIGTEYSAEDYNLEKREVYFLEYIGHGRHKSRTIKF